MCAQARDHRSRAARGAPRHPRAPRSRWPELPRGDRRRGHRRRHSHATCRTPGRRPPDDRAPLQGPWSGVWSSSQASRRACGRDLRRRGSLLEARPTIGRDGLADVHAAGRCSTEERRLFYVAATRARERLVVTAVQGARGRRRPALPLPGANSASNPVTAPRRRPGRPLSVAALVAANCAPPRSTRACPTPSGRPRPAACADGSQRCPTRTAARGAVRPSLPLVGMFEPTENKAPLRNRDQPVVLSGPGAPGPARQHLRPAVVPGPRGRRPTPPATAAQGFGNVVHVLADEVASAAHARPTRQALSENRRSGGRLLDLANGLAEPLRAMHAGVEHSDRPPAPNATASSAAPCCPPTPRRSAGSPTRSRTW
ncbi:hypothetical protein SALBM311S_06441 [Streptomyces alboniger]